MHPPDACPSCCLGQCVTGIRALAPTECSWAFLTYGATRAPQIRLYNLSGLMGVEEWSLASGEAEDDDPGDEVAQPDDDEDDDDDDDDDDEEDGARGRGSGRGSRRRLLAPLHPGRCLPGGSPPRSPSTSGLLACVHRMPSKVSSIAWSPYQVRGRLRRTAFGKALSERGAPWGPRVALPSKGVPYPGQVLGKWCLNLRDIAWPGFSSHAVRHPA